MDKKVRITTFPVPTCHVCGATGKPKYVDLIDRNYGETEDWQVVECINDKCGLLWLNPMPTKEDIGKAYASYYTHSASKKTVLDFAFLEKPYLAVRYGYFSSQSFIQKLLGYLVYVMPVVKTKFDFSILYLPTVKSGKVLDFGCGNGFTLDNLKNGGWECYGLDFDAKAVEFCKSKGLNVNLGDIASQNYPDNYFDAITINHVIEHVHDVDVLVQDCYKKLKKGGKLVIATPNIENWQHKLYKEYWFQLDAPRHLHLYSVANLAVVVERAQFKIENSFSTCRMDAWSTIVTRGFKKHGRFEIGKDKKSKVDLLVGILHQYISVFLLFFNKKAGGEIVVIATK